jgi:alpha-tubulin suppressor-like RCC1 family protein
MVSAPVFAVAQTLLAKYIQNRPPFRERTLRQSARKVMKSLLQASLVLLLGQAVPLSAATIVTNVAAASHTLFIKSDGSLWGSGYNYFGQLGDGTNVNRLLPEKIVSSGVVAVAVGADHSLFLKSDGSLWGMGYHGDGELGLGIPSNPYDNVRIPRLIVSNSVAAIAAGTFHSLLLKSDGSLWAMGYNYYGQLGDGGTTNVGFPKMIVPNVVAIAAGIQHSLFVKTDGSLWGMGYNENGELGDGTNITRILPEQIVASHVVAVAAGARHSLFLESDGSLWAMGANSYGQLGDGSNNNAFAPRRIVSAGVIAIAGGMLHSLFIKSDGTLWGMGSNESSELGPRSTRTAAPIQLSGVAGNLWLQGTCLIGGSYSVVASTNLTLPPNQWMPVQSYAVTVRGQNNFSAFIPDVPSSNVAQQFYRLRSE